MIWLAALLVAAVFGSIGVGWYAPALVGAAVAALVSIDSVAANEFTLTSVLTLAMVVAAIFLAWSAGRTFKRLISAAGS
jgi:hypothetical protein